MERRKLKPSRLMREIRRIGRNNTRAARLLDAMPTDYPDADHDIDERESCMFVGNRKRWWRACPERACRRARACLAPRIICSHALLLSRQRASAAPADTPFVPMNGEWDTVSRDTDVRDKPPAGR